MQGEFGTAIMQHCGVDPEDPDTLIVIDGGTVFRDSDAVIEIWTRLGFPWRALALFRIVPHRLRDPIYRWIASNRYRLFGRKERCFMPDPHFSDRLL